MDEEFWLDNSKLETFMLCPQKYAYRFEEHLLPIERKRDSALMFGGAIHKALETLYKGTAFEQVECPLHTPDLACARCRGATIPRISATFLKQYQDDPDDPKEIRTVDRGLDLLVQYLSKWRREGFKVIAVEIPFELPFYPEGVTFVYVGRIDLFVDWEGVSLVVDHKTTTRFGMIFDSSFKLSGQFTGYMRGAAHKFGRHVTNGLVNAMRVTSKIDDSSFARIYTQRTPEDFDVWERQVNHLAGEILKMRAAKFFPKSAPFACGAYNRVCEYYPLCISAAQTRETLKQSSYEKVPWEPRKDSEDE
jgi:PD-(D/E)XK nuclease superfamily